jgi:hypothetical protein
MEPRLFMPASPPVAPAPGQKSLTMLLEELTCSRREVALLRHAPTEKHRLLAARGALLRAMESYAAALTERGMPTPWKLRDDLSLHRRIGTSRSYSERLPW